MKLITWFFCIYTSLHVSYSLSENNLPNNFGGSKIIEEKRSLHASVRIPLSIVEFKEATAANSTSGFFAANEISTEGDVRTQLIDFSASTSSKKVYEKIVADLASSGFDLLYQCVGVACGKKDGFRLYFSTRLNDVSNSQHYVVASQGKVYKVFYVSEIDGQPRGYLLDVTTQGASNIALSNNLVPFDLGSAILNDSSKLIIDKWLATMPNNTKTVSILGHADSSGSLEKNTRLAEARAKIVNEYILEKFINNSSPKTFPLSVANLARPLSGSRGRYVELMAHL